MKRQRSPSLLSSLHMVCFLWATPGWAFQFPQPPQRVSSFVTTFQKDSNSPWSSTYEHPTTSLFATVVKSDTETKRGNSSSDDKPFHHQQKKKKLSNSKKRYIVKSMFRQAKTLERQGRWKLACDKFQQILEIDPFDAHSHLALARLQARREQSSGILMPNNNNNKEEGFCLELGNNNNNDDDDTPNLFDIASARDAFRRGTSFCPDSVHLWQAWAVHEESHGNIDLARQLFEQALQIDSYNPYVCHAYGLMEKSKCQHYQHAQELWERALTKTSTAALVCSLGELWIAQNQYEKARILYQQHLPNLEHSAKDMTEVYLAMAWLEERYFEDFDKAHELLQNALKLYPTSSLVHVALARLEGRRRQLRPNADQQEGKRAIVRRLANACIHMEQDSAESSSEHSGSSDDGGRVYNAWALMEVKDRNFEKARRILAKGIERYPNDPMLLQAAGKAEERIGNVTGARDLYSSSLSIEPTAPTLVAYAMLELQRPSSDTTNYTYAKGLFEEALLLDPRHGPAYNAYGTAELRYGTEMEARRIFERGVRANCADAASIYHGYAKLELSLGNLDAAREMLKKGLEIAKTNAVGMDSQHRERALFLSHTLGMMELNSNRPKDALEVFLDGIEQYGNSSQLLLGAALCEIKLGKQDSAREFFERSVLNDPKHAQAWQAWGVMEMKAGSINTARKLFDCGIKSAPKHGALWQAYATMEGRLGNANKARSLFVSGIKKSPRYHRLYQCWASLELREENVVAAKRLIAKALTLNKHNGPGWLLAASIEQRLGNDGLVGLILRRGIECAPTDAELYRALGEHLVQKGDIENARQILEKGIDVNPTYAPTYHSLAELEARVFNVDGLAKLNQRAAKIFNNNAMQPSPSTTMAWGARIRARQNNEIPKVVAALAEKIVEDELETENNKLGEEDPFKALENMSLMEDEYVSDLL